MTETAPFTTTTTPKRKRGDLISEARFAVSSIPSNLAKAAFSFQSPRLEPIIRSTDPVDDGNCSPRSKVVQGFRDLAIRETSDGPAGTAAAGSEPEIRGGAITTAGTSRSIDQGWSEPVPDATRFNFNASTTVINTEEDMQLDSNDEDCAVPRKRAKKTAKPKTSNPERPATTTSDNLCAAAVLETSASNHLQKTYPLVNRQVDSKPRARSRAGTPPFSSKWKGKAKSIKGGQQDEGPVIVDPERAALTWQEDEITIYDPEDKDDDGTGINGIGFKPTAAIAYQRAQKRRQQLAEYKKREESEARARRNQRRREHIGGGAEIARRHSIVRVHFSDTPSTTVMTT
ncbi:hypothetical protein GGS21DRAFT_491910 [Xylaria nigripes]|nr:hypothetical protein GGS21DRAFT_491910 [Xylaria nigripes]